MLIGAVFHEAEKTLKKHTIKDFIIGLKVAAVTLDNGAIGTGMMLLEEMDNSCSLHLSYDEIEGMAAIEMAKWALNPNENIIKRTLGMAAINACSYGESFQIVDAKDASLSVTLHDEDIVGVIGYIRPLVYGIENKVKKVIVYDKGQKGKNVYSEETQKELLPHCTVLYITGTTFINHTIDEILERSKNAREIVIVGPTTPLFPGAFRDTSVSILAGGVWKRDFKDEIYKRISCSGGIPTLSPFLEKVSVRVH